MLDKKLTETSILHVNNNSFTGPLIIGAFEKRAPGHLLDFKSSAALVNSQLVASCQLGFLVLLC